MCADRRTLIPLLLGCLLAGTAHAAGSDDVQIHGFAAQGWVQSAGNNIYGHSENKGGSGQYRELGVNASWRPFGPLLLSAQTAAIQEGKAIDEDLLLEYGLADYTVVSGPGGRLGARAGKLKVPIGFYNDSRDAVFTRPGITLPESLYLETSGARAFGYFSAQGSGLYGDWYLGEHAIYLDAMYAWEQELDDRAAIAILRSPANGGRFDLDRGLIARLSDEYGGGRWRFALSYLNTQLAYVPARPPTLPFNQPGGFRFDQGVMSVQYNQPAWSLTSEFTLRRITLDDISVFPFIGPLVQNPAGWYLQGAWRMTQKWQWLLRYDEQVRDLNDRHGTKLSAATQATPAPLPEHYFFARDWTAGTRYDLHPNVSVLAEFHLVDGAASVNPLDNPSFGAGGADRYWNFVTVMLALRF
ncbi:MAG TPA: hypothetical protein VM369_11575 [Candidatus Binatia bacterium]|nr:hypothetical protein [Candidatus Binatia bacterium]